ncbi:MAG TPA: 2-C-methyl-D-erythritol 4-phosphate cytidylyltransferase [Actinomycetota bacterium]|nr:2-C-methyl-D-erythritol 4-phosphate cytidylyltransferase [Actinomycetota bacterium]
MKAGALLLAAGRGERLGADVPKAFLEIGGRTLLAYAVGAIEDCPEVDGFVVAVPVGRERLARDLCSGSGKLLDVVTGGDTRTASTRRALEALPAEFDAVVCHDVARPLTGPKIFSAVLGALADADGVVPVVPIADTVKRVRDGVVTETVDRAGLSAVQTPQAFRREALEDAHARVPDEQATDDAVLVERAGGKVIAVAGDPTNIKVTTPDDVSVAAALLGRHG